MIEVHTTFVNGAQIAEALKRAPHEVIPQLKGAISRSVELVQRTAMRKAPVNKQSGGGNLRQSIKTYIDPLRGRVAAEAKYAAAVEMGTSPHIIRAHGKTLANRRTGQFFGKTVQHPGTRAQPFMRPAVDDSKPEMVQFFRTALVNVLKVIK